LNSYGLNFEEPILDLERKIEELRQFSESRDIDLSKQINELVEQKEKLQTEIYMELTPWDRVRVARHPLRPLASDYIAGMVSNFVELHGDRTYGDDLAMTTGFGELDGLKVMVVAQQKGKDTKEKIACNFGMPHPEGYRKAMLKMRLAAKFGLPIVSLIDTPGAYPGIGAEERGQAQAIASNILEMSLLPTVIVCVVIGEGGSGGALGIGVGDVLCMLENSYYSVISPEGCAAILWRSADNAPEAARAMKVAAGSLLELGIVDEVIPEPLGGAHRDPEGTAQNVKQSIVKHVAELCKLPTDQLLARRYEKYRKLGAYLEEPDPPDEDQ